jgi:WD40 repeat protein
VSIGNTYLPNKPEICLWRAEDGALLHTLEGHTQKVLALAWHSGGRLRASSAEDGQVILWDMAHRAKLNLLRYEDLR